VHRHVARIVAPLIVEYSASRRLVVDYSASRKLVARLVARRRLLRASGCLGTLRGSSRR
jgi:hypothetical protein